MINSTLCILALLLISCAIPVRSESRHLDENGINRFHIERYTDENGLPQNSVYSIAKDELGFIWLSTERGVVRFDGREFTTFDNFGSTYSSASISSFNIDPRPRPDGLYAVNHDQHFIHIHHGQAVIDTMLPKEMRNQPFPYPRKGLGFISERLPNLSYQNSFFAPFVIPAGNDRFFVYDNKTLRYYERKHELGRVDLPDKILWDFFRVGNSLYHLQNGVLTRYAAARKGFRGEGAKFIGEITGDALFLQNEKWEIFWNNAVDQTFVRLGQSLYQITSDKNGDLHSQLLLHGFDFASEEITAVYHDRKAERIFLGSKLNGLVVLTKNKFVALATRFPDTDQVYYGQARIGKSGILSGQGIVYSIDPADGNPKAKQLPFVTQSVAWDKSSILVDVHGYIWCKQKTTLMRIVPDGSKLERSWGLPSEITQLYEGPDRTIWVGTRTGGLYYIKPPFDSRPNAPQRYLGAPLTNISWIEQVGDFIWVATGQGLFRVSRKTREVTGIPGLDGIYVRSVHIRNGGSEIWITTYKDGFFLLNNGRLTHFPLDRKGFLSNTHCIIEDGKGYLWIPTNHGLFQVLKSDLLHYAQKPGEIYYHLYSKADGFNSNEFNGGCEPCAVRVPSGYVSIPSMNGLVWFRPERTAAEFPDNKIILNRVEIDRKTLFPEQDHVTFSQEQKKLSFEVVTPFFGNNQNVEFSYALQEKGSLPSAADWLGTDLATSNKATINISNLGKGRYTLFIRKLNGFGRDNFTYKTVEINVPPFWYETWWFYSVMAISLGVALAQFVKYRTLRVRRANLLLERQINERTGQLQATLRDLENSQQDVLNQMHLQSRLMASIAHNVRSPLGAAIIVAAELQKMIEKRQYDMASLIGKNIEDSMRRVKGTLEDLLAYVKVQVYKHEPKTEMVDLHRMLEENMQLYGKNTRINANTFVNLVPTDTRVMANVPLLKIIIHNLIDNANKFTDNGTVKTYITPHDDLLELVIDDSGRGISQEYITWFEQKGNFEKGSAHGGIGLLMVKELAPAVAEKIRIERLNPGTRVVLAFRRQAPKNGEQMLSDVPAP